MKRKTLSIGALVLMLASPAWAQTASPGAREAMSGSFSALDSNRDGLLSAEELLAPRRAMWGKGASGDAMALDACLRVFKAGFESTGGNLEAQMVSSLANECKRLDKNNDGALSWAEFAGPIWISFKLMDFDGDGFLTLDEFAGQGLQALRRLPPPPQLSPKEKAELDQNIAKANAARVASQLAPRPAPLTGSQTSSSPQAQTAPAADPSRGSDSVYERVQNWFR